MFEGSSGYPKFGYQGCSASKCIATELGDNSEGRRQVFANEFSNKGSFGYCIAFRCPEIRWVNEGGAPQGWCTCVKRRRIFVTALENVLPCTDRFGEAFKDDAW